MKLRIFVVSFTALLLIAASLIIAEDRIINKNVKTTTPDLHQIFEPKQLQEDFDFMVDTIMSVHPNPYKYTDKAELIMFSNQIRLKLTKPMKAIDFYKTIAPLTVKIRDAHTNMIPFTHIDATIKKSALLPFGLFDDILITTDSIYLLKDIPKNPELIKGTKITAIQNQSISEINKSIGCLLPNEHPEKLFCSSSKLFIPFLALIQGFKDDYEIQIETEKGKYKNLTVKGLSLSYMKNNYPASYTKNENMQSRIFQEDRTLYMKINNFNNDPLFEKFIDNCFTEMETGNLNSLIIDLRLNPGGNSICGDIIFAHLYKGKFSQFSSSSIRISKQFKERRGTKGINYRKKDLKNGVVEFGTYKSRPENIDKIFNGKVYVLISGTTASSASAFAATVQDYNRGILIGDETGGLGSTYGDSLLFALPNTGLELRVSCKYFCRPNGDRSNKAVLPDFYVSQNPEDIYQGRDTIIDFTLNHIRQSQEK